MESDAAGRNELRALHDEAERDSEAIQMEVWWHIEMVAWIVRQGVAPLDLARESNWPAGRDVADDPILTWLAHRDPIINELARYQVAVMLEHGDLSGEEVAAGGVIVPPSVARLAADLLPRSTPPRRGQHGDHLARNVMLWQLRGLLEAWTSWGLSPKRKPPVWGASGENLSAFNLLEDSRLAECLSEEIGRHRLLVDLPDAAPSPEAIRAVWRNWRGPPEPFQLR